MPLDAQTESYADDASPMSAPRPVCPSPLNPAGGEKVEAGVGKRHPRRWLIGGVIAALLIVGFLVFTALGPKKVEIVTAPVVKGNIKLSVLATGTLQPARLVSVGAQVSGQLKRPYVEVGSAVKQGDPIADIDSTTQQITVSNAEAGLSNVQAQAPMISASRLNRPPAP